jgi:NADPH-dependent 2,4-dienoyl-CoA reductase/sulfur reductase-like enzyme
MTALRRRRFLLGTAALLAAPRVTRAARPKIVVVGGGFGGSAAARAAAALGLEATLVTAEPSFYACPFSNAVLAGFRPESGQHFGYDGVRRAGVEVAVERAVAVDPDRRTLRLDDGASLAWDRLILAPGIAIAPDRLPGYDAPAAEARMPHAWTGGPAAADLGRRLAAMADGGVVVMAIPANPYRCPPGPYERASLIAHLLKTTKPRSKLILLDAKDQFSKQRLFQAAWARHYPGLIEHVPLSRGGRVTAVDVAAMTLETEFGRHRADVANVVPPQRAAPIAATAGVADRSGWCPIDPMTFESRLVAGIHVIGDAAIAGAMPKSAFAAHGQAAACAEAVAAMLKGEAPVAPKLLNTCYSLVTPEHAISVAGVYTPRGGLLAEVQGAGGTSPPDAPDTVRVMEAAHAAAWFQRITDDCFG